MGPLEGGQFCPQPAFSRLWPSRLRLFHSVKQFHPRSARRRVARDLLIPPGAVPIGDPGGQRGLFGRQFHNGVLNLAASGARFRDSSATNRGAGI